MLGHVQLEEGQRVSRLYPFSPRGPIYSYLVFAEIRNLPFFRTIAIMAIGIISIVSLSCYTGIVIFAAFYDCDPIQTKVQDPSLPLLASSTKYSETNSRVTAN